MTSTNFLVAPLANFANFLKEMVLFAKLLKTPQQTSFVETLCKNLKKPIIFYGKPGGIENSGGLRKRSWSVIIHMRIVDQLSWR